MEPYSKKQKQMELVDKLKSQEPRHFWWEGMRIALPIWDALVQHKNVIKAEVAGSLRRRLETIGDIDFVIASNHFTKVIEWIEKQPWVAEVLLTEEKRISLFLNGGIRADFRLTTEEEYPFALLHFTGSRMHNFKMREIANSKGLCLDEWGLTSLVPQQKPPFYRISKKTLTEKAIYNALDLSYVPPELREDIGEFEAARLGKIPKLIEETDIKGFFHCHTTNSDGHNSLEEMVGCAAQMGFQYIGIADHSKSSVHAHGMDEERLFKQVEEIRSLNKAKKYPIHIFAGLECDILEKGELDFPNEVLKKLDYVVISVHSYFEMDKKKMTQRIIKAIENPYSTIMGHVSGRLLLRRKPYAVDIEKVIDACIANNKFMELNGQPKRLDMDWRYWHKAIEKGLKCAINPDAHRTFDLNYYRSGVNVARKGWLTKQDVINTLPLNKMKALLQTLPRL